jgi:hypothetical protein
VNARNEVQDASVKERRAASGFLESRTWTVVSTGAMATSTQSGPSLLL